MSVHDSSALSRDQAKIDKLKEKYDLSDPKAIEALYTLMISGGVTFESSLGRDFDDEIYELKQKSDLKKKNTSVKKNTIKKASKKIEVQPKEISPAMQKMVENELKKQSIIRNIVIACLALVLIGSMSYLGYYYYSQDRSERRFNDLSEMVGSQVLTIDEPFTVIAKLDSGESKEYSLLSKYASLYNSNKKLIGWLKINDTNIDYPVMQCDDNSFYLSHNFDSEEDKAGALFLDCGNNITSDDDNYIIYGHHLTSGRMFSSLGDYEKESFYEGHKYITFDTIYEEHTYQVMYAFRSRVYNDDDVVFKYYQFLRANSEEEFNSYMKEMNDLSFYDTGVTASYGDTLLTLSTCDYHENNGRFVVVAKRIY